MVDCTYDRNELYNIMVHYGTLTLWYLECVKKVLKMLKIIIRKLHNNLQIDVLLLFTHKSYLLFILSKLLNPFF